VLLGEHPNFAPPEIVKTPPPSTAPAADKSFTIKGAGSREADVRSGRFHSYHGLPDANNQCGQAAIAAVADYWGLSIGNLSPKRRLKKIR
jgi:hypothetical protein